MVGGDDDPRGESRPALSDAPAKAAAPMAPPKAKAPSKAPAPKAPPKAKAPTAKAGGASSSSGLGGAASAPDEFVLVAAPKPHAKGRAGRVRRDARPFIPAIGGGEIYFDEYAGPASSGAKAFNNWIFKCPHHAGCQRVMGDGIKNTSRHGHLEPIAFLHVWRDTPPGEKRHRLTDPLPEDVDNFHDAHKEELQALWEMFATP